MSARRVLLSSPDFQRRLQRSMLAGIGFWARQVPFAYWKKSVQGSAVLSRSSRKMLERWPDGAGAASTVFMLGLPPEPELDLEPGVDVELDDEQAARVRRMG